VGSLLAVDSGDPEYDRRARTLNALVLVAIPAALITAAVVLPFPNGVVSALVLLLAAVILPAVWWLARRGHLGLAVTVFAVGLWGITVGQPVLTGDLSTNPIVVPTAAVMLMYVIPPRHLWWLAVWVVSALLVLYVGTNDLDTVPQTRFSWILNAAITCAVSVAVVAYGTRQLAEYVRKEQHLTLELSVREVTLQRLEELANTDPLTGFLNRRSLEHLTVPPGSAVALVDIDHFKDVNDDFSHAVGDRLLADFAGLLADCARSDDLLYRLGGDEFLVLRADSTAAGLGAWLHEVRERGRHGLWSDLPRGATVTFSGGVVAADHGSLDATIGRVDRAMYAAKEAGRDTIVVID
jgi:diguanylate cyclase (GGDEF)-like protein